MKKNFLKNLVSKYVNGTIKDSHREILESYFNDKQSRKNEAITDEIIRERIFEGINLKISLAGRQKTRNRIYYGVAAAITIMILCTLLIFKLTVSPAGSKHDLTFTTKNGQKKKILLPDGSLAIINAGSKLRYASGFEGRLRSVDLEGEAYFDVAHNVKKPFVVHTKKMDVKVLGTLFNVKAYEGEQAETSLIRGAVQILTPSNTKVLAILKPNQKFVLGLGIDPPTSRKLIAKGKGFMVTAPLLLSSTPKAVDWIHNRLSFDDQDFKEVALLLERWYDIKISIQNTDLLRYRFTGTFNDTGLMDILEALKASQHFNYRKEGDQISIY